MIARDLSGRKSEFHPPSSLTHWFLNTGISPRITGLPNYAVPYFFISQTYDTTEAKRLLRSHNIACPRFKSYVEPLLDFVDDNPML